MRAPPGLRLLERAGPHPAPGRPRLALGGGVAALAVTPIVDGIARAHHDVAEVVAARGADRDVAVVAVLIDRRATDRAAADRRGEGARRRAAARIIAPRTGAALLPALRRIDAEQADALAQNLDRIAVDDARAARDRRTGGGRRRDIVRRLLRDDVPPPPSARGRAQ